MAFETTNSLESWLWDAACSTTGLCPKPEEIILELDDSGDAGRLFKGGRF